MLTFFHEPKFTSNILATHISSESFNIQFSSSCRPSKSCLLLMKGLKMGKDDIIGETQCPNGLYRANANSATY